MNPGDPRKVANRFLTRSSMNRTAGEVRFVKDRSGDKSEWGWGSPGPTERTISENFVFNPKYLKPLAMTLRSSLMALGHATSAHARFVKIKSRNISPDGALGGKGYIEKIPDMRRQLMNVVEALSAFTDTIYDELNAAHWNKAEDTLDARDREEVVDIVQQSEEIKDDPEGWAVEEEKEEDAQFKKKAGVSKTASSTRRYATDHGVALRTAHLGLQTIIRQAEAVGSLQDALHKNAESGELPVAHLERRLFSAQEGLITSVNRYLNVLENA